MISERQQAAGSGGVRRAERQENSKDCNDRGLLTHDAWPVLFECILVLKVDCDWKVGAEAAHAEAQEAGDGGRRRHAQRDQQGGGTRSGTSREAACAARAHTAQGAGRLRRHTRMTLTTASRPSTAQLKPRKVAKLGAGCPARACCFILAAGDPPAGNRRQLLSGGWRRRAPAIVLSSDWAV